MQLIFKPLLGLTMVAALGAQAPPTGTEQIARQEEIDLAIVGSDHPELPNLAYKNYGGFGVRLERGHIDYARILNGDDLVQRILVFYRNWKDEQPLDARAVGCPANPYFALEDPAKCFRAIVEKMEGGRGPVRLQIRFYSSGQPFATIPINSVQIPWMYMKHYAKVESAR